MHKIFGLLFLLFTSLASYADCDDAFRKCRDEFSSVGRLFNYENGKLVNALNTDFVSNCESSCRRGRRYCESESNSSDACYEFRRKCRDDCPSSVFNFSNGSILLLTDANSKCENACSSGHRRCE